MLCPVCPLGPHRSQKREMWVLCTFSGRPIYSHVALVGQVNALRGSGMVSINQHKIEEASGMLNLPIVPTQVTLRGNVGSLDAPIEAQLFTFGQGGRVMHWEGREWSQKIHKK